jgi:hypothetical protein
LGVNIGDLWVDSDKTDAESAEVRGVRGEKQRRKRVEGVRSHPSPNQAGSR